MGMKYLATATLVAMLVPTTILAYDEPQNNQFHIQTDEGPERYFRYQTHSGQYRKEKRLEDGTVVGSYGWIDSTGLLRLRDYIADNAGYRILREKDVYVGRDASISQAVKAAKKAPVSGGDLLKRKPQPVAQQNEVGGDKKGLGFVLSTASPPSGTVETLLRVPGLPKPASSTPPSVQEILIPSSTPSPQITSNTIEPLHINVPDAHPVSPPTVYITSKPYTTPLFTQPPQQPISNSLDYYSSEPSYDHYQKIQNPYYYHNGPTYPIDQHGNPFLGHNAIDGGAGGSSGNRYSPYDGVSVTNDGFRYYVPRAYHEEQSSGGKQEGSFGYIDPFGIRRVVYYNAGPDGFKHRKNNRYVGFNATPYDPRPSYKK